MSRGEHKPGYKRPKTGEPRRVRQNFYINTLPAKTRERIREMRAEGKTWEEISARSLEFSPKRLHPSTLHRWFDVHVEQKENSPLPENLEKLASLITERVFKLLKERLEKEAA